MPLSKKRLALALCIAALFSMNSSHADEVYTFVVKKQEQKAKTRWTLSEWLETRDRMRLMDLWLALHSPSPYEFYVGGDYQLATKGSGDLNAFRVHAAAYASIFGLELQRGISPLSDWQGLFHLRIFGFHSQGTHITPELGIRSQTEPYSARNATAGVSFALCLSRFFGFEGLYRHHFASTPNSSGTQQSSDQLEGGAFIDFKFLRLYGLYHYIPETVIGPYGTSKTTRSGVTLGTRLYF